MKVNKLFLALLLAGTLSALGQPFEWKASLPGIRTSGFYIIPISPQIHARSAHQLASLRLHSDKGQEVPYVVKQDQYSFDRRYFQEHPLESKEIVKGCCTKLVIHNKEGKNWNNFCLLVKNHEVTKTATLRGSDDNENWFALREAVEFPPVNSLDETIGTCYISFPLSNYKFFSLTIHDSTTPPLNIQQVGYYDAEVRFGTFVPIPSPSIAQHDSIRLKKTFIHLNYDAPYPIDKLLLHFEGPKFFSRNAHLNIIETDPKGKKTESYYQSFQIESGKELELKLNGNRYKEYQIEIENGDNPALRLKSIEAFQLNTYLISYLEAGNMYELRLGNKDMSPPSYDLSKFTDSIKGELPILPLGPLTKVQLPTPPVEEEPFFKSNWWIWGAIGVVLAILGVMSLRMLKEMEKEGNQTK